MTRFNGDSGLDFFEMVNDAVVVWEPGDEVILQANRFACQMYGIDKDELIGSSLRRFTLDVERGVGEVEYLLEHRRHHNYRTTHRRADGEPIHILVNSSVYDTEDGTVVLSVLRDITDQLETEQMLQQRTAELESIFRSIPDSVVFCDTDWEIVTVNPAFVATFGYEKREIVGEKLGTLQADARNEELSAALKHAPASSVVNDEVQFVRNSGEVFFGERVAVRVSGEGGQHLGYLCVIRDITAQREAEHRLRTSEQKLSLFVHRSPLAFIEWSAEGTVNEWNPAAEEIFGFSREEAVGRSMRELIVPDYLLDKVDDTWTALISRRGGERIVVENERRDGEVITCEWYNTTLVDDEGHVMGVASLARDVTEQERIEQELRASEARYRSVVNSIREVIFQTNAEGQWTFLNAAWTDITGYTVDESLGRPFYSYIHPEDREKNRELFEPLFSGEVEYVRHELRYMTKGGEVRWVEVFTRLLLDEDGTMIGTTGTCMDITERKEAEVALRAYARELERAKEEAEAATRAKSEFLANMSHEIRTPLNGVIGMTSLLLETELTEDQREFIETIRTSGDALMTVINDILDFSKIEAGKLDLEMQPFSVRECVEEALDLVVPQATEKNLELAYFVEDDVPATVEGDITRVRQVLVNLLSNAVKFTEEGEVYVEVAARPAEDASSYELSFSVNDTGIGIPEDRLDGLFDSFSQVDASTTRQHGGTGLGLAICKLLTTMMGGAIEVESEEGAGSTFTFTIEARAVDVPLKRFLRPEQPHLKGRHALVVDDNEVNRCILQRLCHKWGMQTSEAASGEEALASLDACPGVDVILLDMQMPEMDGVMLAAAIAKRYISCPPPMLMVTSLGQDVRAEAEGIEATLHKPIKPSQLYNALVDIFHAGGQPSNAGPPDVRQNGEAPGKRADEREVRPTRILLAEDNPVNQKVALTMLKRLGFRADVVGNGLEAIDVLRQRPYDLVFMDVQMPELDGLEATRQIRNELPEEEQPQIVAMTANAMMGDRERCLEAGMDDYLSKPVRTEEMKDVLEKYGGVAAEEPEDLEPLATVTSTRPVTAFAQQLRQRVAGYAGADDSDFICEIIMDYLDSAPSLLEELRDGVEAGDAELIEQTTHTLKSSSAMFGGEKLAERCAEMERMARKGELERVGQNVSVVEELYGRFSARLRAALGQIGG